MHLADMHVARWLTTLLLPTVALGACHLVNGADEFTFGSGGAGETGGVGGIAAGGTAAGGMGETGAGGETCDGCSPCTDDVDCGALAFCEPSPSGGVCKAKRVVGDVCSTPNQCLSGSCPGEDGVCCNSLCAATCEACLASKTGVSNGICELVDVALDPDPDGECDATPPLTCGSNGAGCTGTTTACALHPDGTTCQAASCTGSTFVASSTCNGDGSCEAGTTSSCAPYQCSTTTPVCRSSCLTDLECTAQAYCSVTNNCVPKKANGASCSADFQCQDGFCVDGICCDTPCTGTCVACSTAKTGAANGTCAVIPQGSDPDSECTGIEVCDGAGSCQCAGVGVDKPLGACCQAGSECLSGQCADGVCCDAACSSLCESCDGGQTGRASGICSAIPSGGDPSSECTGEQVCDGSGSCSLCFASATSTGGACPAQCTGGCIDGGTTCVIDCLGNNACKNTTVACPAGFACDVRCGFKGCQDATILCPAGTTACEVVCELEQGCQNAQIQCGGGICDLTCASAAAACLDTDLVCGTRACSATCGGSSQPTVACGSACSCEPC